MATKTRKIHTAYDAGKARRSLAAEWAQLDARETAERERVAAVLAANPSIGTLIKDGRPMYYLVRSSGRRGRSMTTLTQQLADALLMAADALAPYMDYCSDAGPNDAMRANTEARTALAAWEAAEAVANDLDRPLAVGDRVRVVAPHALTGFYCDYGLGTELIVKEMGTGTLLRCAKDDEPNYALNYAPYELQRIPTTQPEKQA